MPAVLGETVKPGKPPLVQIRPSFSWFAEIGGNFAFEAAQIAAMRGFFAPRRATAPPLTLFLQSRERFGERRDPYRGIYRSGAMADIFTKLTPVVMGPPCVRRDDIRA
jgi:hypothetical protein